jgi:GNAT superfamily N-acetyltransferase
MATSMADIRELDGPAAERHLDELGALLLDAHAANMALGQRAPLTLDGARAAWRGLAARLEPDERILLGAFDGDLLVGSVVLARADAVNGRHRAQVQRLAVRATHRRGGIGRALLEAAAERARAIGVTLLLLSTHAGTDSDRFYAALGWTRYGVVPGWAELPDGTMSANAFYYRVL